MQRFALLLFIAILIDAALRAAFIYGLHLFMACIYLWPAQAGQFNRFFILQASLIYFHSAGHFNRKFYTGHFNRCSASRCIYLFMAISLKAAI
jgi:hypothetical protein